MSTHGLEAFDRTLQHTHHWLDDLMGELGTGSRQHAWHALTVVLHAIRDRLPATESAHLAAQLPMLVRGMYYEGWRPTMQPVRRGRRAFEQELAQAFPEAWADGPEHVAAAVFRVLERRVSPGEIRDVVHVLPADVRAIWQRGDA